MEQHLKILQLAAKQELPEQLDEKSEFPIDVVSELIDAGHLKAIDASSFDGTAYLQTKITLQGREYLKELKSQVEKKIKPSPIEQSENGMKIFISHSSADKEIAQTFIDFLRAALPLKAKDIRCTSVDGYKLAAGTNSDEQLRQEIFEAQAFLALLSPASMKSVYVMFELGARWGAKRYFAPIMVSGLTPSALKAPLSAIHAVSASEGDLHQLIQDLSARLGVEAEQPNAYMKALRSFIKVSKWI